MWVRGLKLGTGAGVSIDNWSHPMWVRGLKLIIILLPISIFLVAPHVGAWIETNLTIDTDTKAKVAPHVGAWIETLLRKLLAMAQCRSHPMWVRGLKPSGR